MHLFCLLPPRVCRVPPATPVTHERFCTEQGYADIGSKHCQSYHQLNVSRGFAAMLVILTGLYVLLAFVAQSVRSFKRLALVTIALASQC